MIWDAARRVTFGVNDLHDTTGYNPYAGSRSPAGPTPCCRAARSCWRKAKSKAAPARGKRIIMQRSAAMQARENAPAPASYP